MNNGLERIRQGYQSLKPSEQKAASYILNHPERILDMAIAELAKETSVSEATIIRMCRSLYFKGYKDLKLSISASINQLEQSFYQYRDISPDASLPEIIQYVTENNIASIKSTLAILHEEKIQEAIHELDKARKIIVVGVGASAIVAQDFEQKLKRIDRWCEVFTDSHSQLTAAVHLQPEDTVFAISYSGETKEIIDVINIAKRNQSKIISLTKYSKNTVQGLSDINLFASAMEENIRSGATASRIAQLCIIDILYTGLASLKYKESVQYLEKTRKVIQNRFHKYGDVNHV